MENRSLQEALQNYAENKASPEEVRWLLAHFHTETEDELMQLLMKGFELDQPAEAKNNPDQAVLNRVYGHLQQDLGFSGERTAMRPMRKIRNFAAAAAVLAGLTTGGYFLIHKQPSRQQTAQNQKNDIAPGHNQATLTLANGKKIILTKGLNGLLAKQGQTTINATPDNIIYNAAKTGDQVNYNTLSTAKGEQSPYPLVLADGSKVWLNAESSITFPTAFHGKERLVKITGEALLEVAHNDKQPFKVETGRQAIEDIGTTFDVNAYADEPANTTTLIEGSVKVNGRLLNPGQQAVNTNKGFAVREADPEQVVAWKNGDFIFKDEDLKIVMRKIARWYNVDIVYDPGSPSSHIPFGIVSRSKNISAVLGIMEMTGKVHFSVEGRRVTVSR